MRVRVFVIYDKDEWGCDSCGSSCSVEILNVVFTEKDAAELTRGRSLDYEGVDIEIPESQIKLWASQLSQCS